MPIIRASPVLALVALGVALLASRPARASDGPWQKVYDRPAPDATAIAMFDDRYGLAVIGYGVQRTIDGGATWRETDPGVGVGGGQIAIADRQRAWIAGYSGVILRTDDGGLSWRRQATGTEAHFNGIAALSADEAWATAYGEGFSDVGPFTHAASVLLHTVDAGATWSPVRMSGYGIFSGVSAAGGVLWLTASPCFPGEPFQARPDGPVPCRDRTTLLRSADGGRTWDLLAQEPAPVPTQISRVDALRAFGVRQSCGASFCVEEIAATADGGRTWEARPSPAVSGRMYLNALRFSGPDDGWATLSDCAADCRYSLAHTTDGARTWRLVEMPAITSSWALAVTSAHVLVAAGDTGVQRYGRAAGAWQAAATDARPVLMTVAFTSAERGYSLVGGALWVSDDGGAIWQPGPPSPRLAHLVITAGGAFWATGEDGRLLRSDDAGATWRALDGAPGPLFGGLQASDGRRAWLTLVDGLWRTDDGGGSWRQVDGAKYARYRFADRDHGWTTSCLEARWCDDTLRVTSDGGDTWQTRLRPRGAESIAFIGGAHGWGSVTDNRTVDDVACPCVVSTADGGRSWRAWSTAPWHLGSLTFADARRGWAIAWDTRVTPPAVQRPLLVATADGGRTWTPELEMVGYSGGGVTLGGGRAWLQLGVSGNPWQFGRLILYRRHVAALLRLTAPDTGAGPRSQGGAPLAAMLALAAGGVALGVGAQVVRSRK